MRFSWSSRKSLLKWQRAELNEWIGENLSQLTMFGLVDEPLQNTLTELQAFQLGIELDPDSDLSAQEQLDRHIGFSHSDDDDEYDIDDEQDDLDEQALEEVLVDYLNQQQARMDDIIEKSPMHEMAFSEFYSKNPATVTRRINAHLRKVRERRRSITDFLTEVKTLKSLKPMLESRYESRSFNEGWF